MYFVLFVVYFQVILQDVPQKCMLNVLYIEAIAELRSHLENENVLHGVFFCRSKAPA